MVYVSLGGVAAQVGFPYCENFSEGTAQSRTVFGGSARLVDGVLRLTDIQENQYGYIYIDIPFPSSLGIKASFEYFSYGGSGADGLTVFLFDADVGEFSPGGFGGSLGYSPREGSNSQGLTRGFIGVGFDSFGNFGNSSEGKNGGFPGPSDQRHPNAIVVRGPGSSATGYEFVTGRKTNSGGDNGLQINDLFPLSSGGFGTQRVIDPEVPGYRKVSLNLEPSEDETGFLLSLDMLVTTESGNPRSVNIFDKVSYPYSAPPNLKIGFAASTGGETNYHEIRNLIVEVSDEDNLLEPIAYDITDQASCEGQENTYSISGEQLTLPNTNSVIRCLQLYASLDEIEAEADDICSQSKCLPENREMVLPQGIFRAGDEGGEFTFFPNYGYLDEIIRIYYTVTDNYGKTSAGNFIELLIQESPDPINLEIEGMEVGLESLRICDGETKQLVAIGEEDYFRYEWFKDEEKIAQSDRGTLEINQSGIYKVFAYNSKGCPVVSRSIELIIPPIPDFKIDSLVVGCEMDQIFDVRSLISGYDDQLYDYLLQTPAGTTLLNDEMNAVGLAGNYLLKAKHKDLDCYSDPIAFSIVINEEELLPDFDFEVDGTGINNEDEGGIFIDDPIRFIDKTQGDVVAWFWDFGDGNTSTDQSPVHVLAGRGLLK
ncbi:MAG TPA: PKD domain-containing protein [Anditalea sp.]|nr:PKD domain-containing protein [Anditalea sp.]